MKKIIIEGNTSMTKALIDVANKQVHLNKVIGYVHAQATIQQDTPSICWHLQNKKKIVKYYRCNTKSSLIMKL